MEWPLHYACRIGSFGEVKYMVEIRRYPINEKDDFNRTPLYFAALIGHHMICQYLLEHGAICEPDSIGGDAARIFYVALTPELRRLLRCWSLSAKTYNPFYNYIRKTYNNPIYYSDCIILLHCCCHNNNPINNNSPMISNTSKIPYQTIHVHKIMLQYRCPILANMIYEMENNNNNDSKGKSSIDSSFGDETIYDIVFENSYQVDGMKLLFEYFYTGTIHISTFDMAITIIELIKKYNIKSLINSLQKAIDEHLLDITNESNDLRNYYVSTSSSSKKSVIVDNLECDNERQQQSLFRCQISELEQLNDDMKDMARIVSMSHSEFESYSQLHDVAQSSDVTIQCTTDSTWSLNRFRICIQSEYFEGALHNDSGFKESNESLLDLTMVITNPETIKLSIQYMYCNHFLDQPSTIHIAIEILEFGFFILCSQLSIYVANHYLASVIDMTNVWDFLYIARLHQLERFEENCIDFVGTNFMSFYQSNKLQELLTEEIQVTKQSGDINVVDIPIASEIKRAINKSSSLTIDQKSLSLDTLRSLVSEIAGTEINVQS